MITIFHDPDSATSRGVLALIRNSGAEPRIVLMRHAAPTWDHFIDLIRRMVDFLPWSGGVRSERHAAERMVIPSMLARASAGVR
jgi:arsenate reductase-like glutaredoxin family protein